MKLGVVGGAGLLGSTSAFLAGMKGYLEEIKLLDVKENLVKNHVMDMAQAIYSSSDTKVTFAQYKDLSDCGAILITASLPERKVANRLEYLWDNMNIIKPVCESIRENCPHQPVIINATNPVDIFNYIIWKELGWDRKKIVGFNGNDTYRLKWAASIVTGKPFSDIDGFAIGEHGNGQINLYDKMTCGGEPLGLTGDEIGKIESITANFFSEMNALNSGRTSGWTSAVNIGRHLLPHPPSADGHYVGDERRDVPLHRQDQDDLQRAEPRQLSQQVGQQRPRRGIQADERIIHDEDARSAQQGFGQLELPQLATGEQDDGLVHQRIQPEQGEQPPHVVRIFITPQQLAHRGRIVLVVGVPPLLVIVVGVRAPVRVAEGNVLHVLINGLPNGRAEIILHAAGHQRILARQHVYQQALPRPVGADNGHVLAGLPLQTDGNGQPYLRMAGHGLRQADCIRLFCHKLLILKRAKIRTSPAKETKRRKYFADCRGFPIFVGLI